MNWIKRQLNRFKKYLIGLVIGSTALAAGIAADNQIDPYTDYADKYEITTDKQDEGIERTSFSKLKPEMTLGKWNDEVQMKVEYSLNATGDRQFLTDKIEWVGTDEKVVAYPIADGYEFEIILEKKPLTNIFSFTITGTENLDFFYQPALTQKEIDEGASRPDNVINSFAVYHKTKANHKTGSVDYKTGKAFHWYRPQATDANGNWIWVELLYDGKVGIMSYTIDPVWLNLATYPVKF